MNILLPVDGSDYTRRTLSYLASHPELLNGKVEFTALTVTPPITPGALAMLPGDFVTEYYDDQAGSVFDPVREFATSKGWTLKTLAHVGNAAETIAAVAGAGQYDLIVMGSHGRSGLMSMVMGSVVSQVLARTKTPVLIIR